MLRERLHGSMAIARHGCVTSTCQEGARLVSLTAVCGRVHRTLCTAHARVHNLAHNSNCYLGTPKGIDRRKIPTSSRYRAYSRLQCGTCACTCTCTCACTCTCYYMYVHVAAMYAHPTLPYITYTLTLYPCITPYITHTLPIDITHTPTSRLRMCARKPAAQMVSHFFGSQVHR